jgi:hypothetical protein
MPGRQTRGNHGLVAVGRGNLHRLRFTVMLAGSSTQTAVACPSWRSALVGSLMTCTPAWPSGAGVHVDRGAQRGRIARASDTLTGKVRVTGSALAATSRTLPSMSVVPPTHAPPLPSPV